MYPVIRVFGINIYPYGLMIGIGLVAAIMLFVRRSKAKGYNEDSAFNMAMTCGLLGILGAKLFYIIIEFPMLREDPIMIIKNFSDGFVLYGGVIVGITVGYAYARIKKWPFYSILDIAVPSISLAQAFGRVGCFFAGCCYGQETEAFWGIKFNNSPFAPNDVHLIPTQVISSLGNLLIFAILLWFDKNKKTRDGQTGALYLILYSIGRFIVEFFRDDPRGTVFDILSTSQFICIFVFAAGVIMLLHSKRMPLLSEIESAAAEEDIEAAMEAEPNTEAQDEEQSEEIPRSEVVEEDEEIK